MGDESACGKARNAKELFEVWKKTYNGEYDTRGIFEKEIEAYQIGKKKRTIKDLQPVTQVVQPKYHEFATILRQHNVSGRENAFDKLVIASRAFWKPCLKPNANAMN